MFAFVDETGNTGPNLFDQNQPEFFTGALVTKSNFDALHNRTLQTICHRNGIDSLHASTLGFSSLERIAPDLLRLLKRTDARFIVSRVEKQYLLATKVFDTFFDSGENPAVPWHVYNVRPLRLILCFKVATLLTEEIAHDFWAMLMARTENQARSRIPDICDAIMARTSKLADERSRKIVQEALSWSREHPEALDIFVPRRQAKNGHMPNMVGFISLLDGLEHLSQIWKRPVRKIVHDRQSQFENSFAEWHRLYSNASPEPIHRPGEIVVLQKVAGSIFEISASDDSPGIQVIDSVLWLYRQFFNRKEIPFHSTRILDYLFRKGIHNDFSFTGVGSQVKKLISSMTAAGISPEDLKAGQELAANMEDDRRRLVALYDEDGLMPYERDPRKLVESSK